MPDMDDGRGDRLLRLAPLGLLAASLVWVTSRAATRIDDPDAWWHLRLGYDFWHQHSLEAPQRWSSFADRSWVPTEPVPELVAALMHKGLGLPGVAWMFGMALCAVTVSLYALTRWLATPLPAAVVTAIALVPMYGSMTSRPQLISFVLLPITIGVWIRTESDLQPRWWLVPLFWLWSLCHGFWFIGVAYCLGGTVAVIVGRRASSTQVLRLLAVGVAGFAVVLLNPLGPAVLEAPFRVQDGAKYIAEWQRPDPLAAGPLTAWLMIVLALALLAKNRQGITPYRVVLLVSAALWAWYAERTVILSALASAPVLAGALDAYVREGPTVLGERGRLSGLEWKVVGGSLLALAVGLGLAVPHTSRDPGGVPLALDAQLDRLPAGTPVLNAYVLGGWITWRHPDLNQYIDGLATPYSPGHAKDFNTIENQGPGWYRLVLSSRAPVALVAGDSTLAVSLEKRGWVSRGSDAGFVLLIRPDAAG